MLLLRNEEIDSLLTGIDWRSLPTLSDMVTGRVKGRETDDQITGFRQQCRPRSAVRGGRRQGI